MIERARLYAEQKHGLAKRRSGLAIDHVRTVVSNLSDIGVRDPATICAAWLHDTIEDTNADYDEISRGFGTAVAAMVSSLSKDNRLPADERTAEYTARLSRAMPGAMTVKLADILANLESMARQNPGTPKIHRRAAKLRTYLLAIRPGIDLDLPGIPDVQKRLDILMRMYGLEPVPLSGY